MKSSNSKSLEPVRKNSRTHIVPQTQVRHPGKWSAADDDDDMEFSGRFLLAVIAQWWRIILPTTLLLGVVSTALTLCFFQPKYPASAWLKIAENQSFLAFPKPMDSKRFVFSQMELLRSPLVLGKVVSRPEIAKMRDLRNRTDPVSWLSRRGIEIKPIGESEYLEIAYTGSNAEDSARLVNSLVESYFDILTDHETEYANRMIEILEEQQKIKSLEVAELKENVRLLGQQLVATDPFLSSLPGNDVIVMSDPLKELQNRLTSVEVEHKTLQAAALALKESLEQQEESPVPDAVVSMRIEQNEGVIKLKQQIAEKRVLMTRTATIATRKQQDLSYVRLNRDMVQLQMQLHELKDGLRSEMSTQISNEIAMQQQVELNEMHKEIEFQRITELNLRERFHDKLKEATQSGGRSLDLEFAKAELDREQTVLNMIAQRVSERKAELRDPGRVSLLHAAAIPIEPLEKYPVKILGICLGLSALLPFGCAFLWERSQRRVINSRQLEHADMMVVGEISRLPSKLVSSGDKGGMGRSGRDLGLFEESIDSLRTGLVLSEGADGLQVLAVCSAVTGEGKTSVASQLAVSIVRSSGEPTLLIDGDLRAPDMHRIFQIPLKPGLAQVLENESSLDNAINRSWSEHVHVLPAGELHKSPHKLLGNGSFEKVLEGLRKHYRHIIIDTPPVLAASEALYIARVADGALVCAMRDVSRGGHVRMVVRRLRETGARTIGTVLNGVPARQYAYHYGDYRYSRVSSSTPD